MSCRVQPHKDNGDFARVRHQWSLDNFDDGHVDNHGRFRVYMPNHPRAYHEGYMLRAIVAYEAYTGETVEACFDIHHKNRNRLDDSRENLEKKLHGKHSSDHHMAKTVWLERECVECEAKFKIKAYRLNDPTHLGKYCSAYCYEHRSHSTEQAKAKISLGLKKAYAEGRR